MARSRLQSRLKAEALEGIIAVLKARYPKPTTSYFLKTRFDVSDRCVHRYIRCLRERGVVIDGFAGYGGGFILNEKMRRVA